MKSTFRILLAGLCACLCTCSWAQTESDWHGYRMLEWECAGQAARLVLPHEAHPDRHWIWRARFWGHEPQTDLALLEQGFHVAWIDVANLYGSDRAMALFDSLYNNLHDTYDLNEKVVLEGFSRGGLPVYRWAALHPGRVACIYADAPVCDIRSWPGGKGSGKGAPADWERCLQAYNLTEATSSQWWEQFNEEVGRVARAGIPALHVCGRADAVVPVEENSYLVRDIFRQEAGPFQMILKDGIGHHPHSLKDPRPIVRFILEHTDPTRIDADMAAPVSPTVHFRQPLANSHLRFQTADTTRVAFLGGSITYNPGWRDSIMQYLQYRYPQQPFVFTNAGIPSMGSVPGAFRLERDVLDHGPIDLLFVEAAVNDATNGRSDTAMIRGMEGIVRHVREASPYTDIVMMHFVDPDKMADYNQGQVPLVIRQHEQVAEHYGITSIDLAKEVRDRILNGEFTWDEDFKDLHPSPFGQGVYARTMLWVLDSLLQEGTRQSHPLPERPLDPYSYSGGSLLSIEAATLGQGWTRHVDWAPSDSLGTRDGFVHVPALEALQPDAVLSLDFSGRAIGLFITAGADVGVLSYKIDDGPWRKVDPYTQWSHWLHLPWLLMLDDELTPAPHRLTLRTTDQKHPDSRGYAARIYYFTINP